LQESQIQKGRNANIREQWKGGFVSLQCRNVNTKSTGRSMVHSLLKLKAHKDIQKKPILKQLLSLFRPNEEKIRENKSTRISVRPSNETITTVPSSLESNTNKFTKNGKITVRAIAVDMLTSKMEFTLPQLAISSTK
jgi:hypothetical protein